MDRRFWTILVLIVVVFGGILAFSKQSNNGSTSSKTTQVSNHVKGTSPKNVTLVEYGDYQCSVCEAYEPIVEQVVAQNSDKIHFQFRNLPLVSLHPNAFASARAAEAAALQNKFWEMHDTLYASSNWQSWTGSTSPINFFKQYAQDLGLNTEKFGQDFASSQVNDTINADLAEFKKTGQQQATPSFFLDGKFIEYTKLTDASGQPTADKFQALINAELASH